MTEPKWIRRDPPGWDVPHDLLQAFEGGLDTASPERSGSRARVLGYGEISTVFEIDQDPFRGWAMKRMSVFTTLDEVMRYAERYEEYNRLLTGSIGLNVPDHGYATVWSRSRRPILYLVQRKVASDAIATRAFRPLAVSEAQVCLRRILTELQKVWEFNLRQTRFRVAIDGQLSNWALVDPGGPDSGTGFLYLDTSTPLYRVDEVEQLDPELFLRSAPSFLVWILRLLFLKEVMERYYRPRRILLDLIANLYKEGLESLIPAALAEAEPVLVRWAGEDERRPFREQEIRAYYRQDAFIWTLFLSMRRFDRFLHRRVYRREYPYILPGVIRR